MSQKRETWETVSINWRGVALVLMSSSGSLSRESGHIHVHGMFRGTITPDSEQP